MQPLTGANMPSNAANFLKAIDSMMKGGPLNPGKVINKIFTDPNQNSVPVMKRELTSTISNTNITNDQIVQQMVQNQFTTSNPLIETGFFIMLMFISIIASITFTIMRATLNSCGYCGKWIQIKILRRLKKVFMFSLFIRA